MALADRFRLALDAMDPPRSQADLAKACSLRGPSVSNWLTGETQSLRANSAILAADFLGVRPRWLIDGVGPMRASTARAVGVAPPAPTLAEALPVVLDALAAAPERAELRRLLPMLADTDAAAYRQRLAELLGAGGATPKRHSAAA